MTTDVLPDELARPVVLGLGVTGAAVVRALVRRGAAVVVVDDHPDRVGPTADALGVDLRTAPPDRAGWSALLADATALLPSPGIPDAHPAMLAARGDDVPVRSELDLAAAFDDRPVLAITGTNGKTTVTSLVTAMVRAGGRVAVDAGNTDVPLVAAIDDPAVEVFVVEASSFRRAHTHHLTARVGTWLNFAPDHLDVHASLAGYEQAKARIWRDLPPDGVAVANADDPVVLGHAPADGRTVTFGLGGGDADWTVRDGALLAPSGDAVAGVDELARHLPHDLANALAAAATAVAGGTGLDGARQGLLGFTGLSHRVERVGEAGGVTWWDDSKATTPHATRAAVAGFDSVVLIAGGRNKGLDLSGLAEATERIRSVVAIGESAPEVVAAFDGRRPVVTATSMAEAVALAAAAARPGDAVVLSPGCASFDWYGSYAERGDDFVAEVRRHLADRTGSTDQGRSRP